MKENDRDSDRFETLLRHSVQTAPIAQPPPGFARTMERLVAGRAEDAGVESWLTRIALWVTAIAIIGFSLPHVARVASHFRQLMGDAPWPLLLSVLAILAMVKLMEFMPPRI